MNLKEYITNVIVDVAEGILEAKTSLKEKDVQINPKLSSRPISSNDRSVQELKISVAITLDETSTDESGIGVDKIIRVGKSKSASYTENTTNNVAFSVPLSLPYHAD